MENLQHIINKASNGHETAQRQLYDQYKSQWFMVSLRYGRNRMEAEDIMQEGLINIFNNLKKFDSHKAGFSTWTNRIITNAALTYLKKSTWANSMSGLDQVYNESEEVETVYEKLSAKELTALVQKLPLGYRLVFNMYAIEGYTHKEIAEKLDISIGTSKSQLFKARKELQRTLESQLKSSRYE